MHIADPGAVLVAKVNAGLPHTEGDVTAYDATPEDMATYAKAVYERGARRRAEPPYASRAGYSRP